MSGRLGGSKQTYPKSEELNSDDDSDEEGLSELMSNFNATSYSKNSGKGEDLRNPKAAKRNGRLMDGYASNNNNSNDKLMMTMKPWQRNASPPARSGVKGKIDSIGEQDSAEEDSFSDDELCYNTNKKALRPSQQPKSPSAPSHESIVVPKPLPRQRNVPEHSPPATGSRHSPYDAIDGLPTKDPRKTPVQHSKSPLLAVDKKRDRHAVDENDDPHSRRNKQGNSPVNKSPEGNFKGGTASSQLPQYRGTPVDGYRASPLDYGNSPVEAFSDFHTVRKYSTGSAHRDNVEQYQDELYGQRKSPAERFTSPNENRSRNSPADTIVSARKSPSIAELSTKTKQPKASMNREAESPATVKRKESVVDFLTETSEKFNGSPSLCRPSSGTAKIPFDQGRKMAKEKSFDDNVPVAKKKLDKAKSDQQSLTREKSEEDLMSDADSSVCNDLIEEPVKQSDTEGIKTAPEKQVKLSSSERLKADSAIDLVKETQSANKMKFIDPMDVKPTAKRPSSASASGTILKPQPRYVKPSVAKSPNEPTPSFDSTEAIREAVFEEWKGKRLERVKQDILEKQRKEKEAEEKKLKSKQEKEEDAKKAYLAWLSDKKGYVSDKTKKKKMEEEKALKEEKEQKRKKQDAEVTFAQWKAQIDVQLKEKQKQSLKKTKKVEEKKKEDEEDKKQQARSAYLSWKEKKDAVITKTVEEQMKAQKEKEKRERQDAQLEAEEARRAYEHWLEEKERRENSRAHLELEKRPSWRPSSSTVPFGRSH